MGAYSTGGAYSRGCLFDIAVSRVGAYSRLGAYSRGRLIEALRYLNCSYV